MRQEHRKKVLDEVDRDPARAAVGGRPGELRRLPLPVPDVGGGVPVSLPVDSHRRLRRRPEHRAGHRHPQLHQRQGLRGLAGPALRVPRLHRSEHRADARGHADERAAAEDHREPREDSSSIAWSTASPTTAASTARFARFPAAHPGCRPGTPVRRGPRARARDTSSRPLRGCATSSSKDYLPVCYDQVGWWQTSSGLAGYAYLARLYTTTDLTPQQIHEIGLKEVARIQGEHGAGQDARPASRARCRSSSRTSGPTRGSSTRPPDDLLDGYRAVAKRIDPELVKVIGTPPRMPYGVTPIPDAVAPNVTTAYANAGAPDGSRPGLFLREPLQAGDAAEVGDAGADAARGRARPLPADVDRAGAHGHAGLPAQRGLHGLCRGLGALRGVARRGHGSLQGRPLLTLRPAHLRDVARRAAGRSTRACTRCTGIAQRAITYFMENAAKTELDVTNEIDRYIGWPGQALAYKIGELKIKELRHARPSRSSGTSSACERSTTWCSRGARCRSKCSKRRWMVGSSRQ